MKFTQAWHQLKHWQEERRREILPEVIDRTGNIIQHGPFAGLKLAPEWCWGDGDHAAKLLGIYECELYDATLSHLNNKPDLIANIGCAEGFWGVACASKIDADLFFVDVEPRALELAGKNAQLNDIKYAGTTEFDTDKFNAFLNKYNNPFVFMDCEGAELDYLDPVKVPEIIRASVVVETHDCFIEGVSATVAERLADSHDIQVIMQGAKNPCVDPINDFGDEDKWILVNENRPHTMFWLSMSPKQR
jgi:ribosomal protein L11 methylase PrmA